MEEGDTVIIAAKEYLEKDGLIILIQRGGADIIPDGESIVEEGDILVLYSKST